MRRLNPEGLLIPLAYIDPMSGAVLIQLALAAVIGLALRVALGIKQLISNRTQEGPAPDAREKRHDE